MTSGDTMNAFIEQINTGFGTDAMWGVVGNLAPIMITFGLTALGYYLFRRLSKGATKLKFRP